MAAIKVRRTGEEFSGRAWDSIARRVWGRKAEVRVGERVSPGEALFFGTVVKRDPRGDGFFVLADVVLYE